MNRLGKRRLHIFVQLALITLFAPAVLSQSAPMTVSFLDVGQGDSILVQFPNNINMLVDAGDGVHSQIVVDYLRSLKIQKIDILVATHPHSDHICLLYTSPSPRDRTRSRMPSSA